MKTEIFLKTGLDRANHVDPPQHSAVRASGGRPIWSKARPAARYRLRSRIMLQIEAARLEAAKLGGVVHKR
jgi:hypothetical protein